MESRIHAAQAVRDAQASGRLPHPSTLQCQGQMQVTTIYRSYPYFAEDYSQCNKRGHVWHHTHGYAPEHYLTVIPLCGACHRCAHNGTIRRVTQTKD